MTGEKIKPLVIGKAAKPRCFQRICTDTLPVTYKNNKKAWMNSAIYEDWLKALNRKMKRADRNILLFVDNAPSHPAGVAELSNVNVKYFPPNTTSCTQPMDQGIIQTLKLKFRKRQLLKMVREMELQPTMCGSQLLKQTSVLDVIYWVANSWKEVQVSTITKCFARCGFITPQEKSDTDPQDVIEDDDEDPDDDVPLAAMQMSKELFGCDFKDLVEIDNSIHTCDVESVDWARNAGEILENMGPAQKDQVSDDEGDDDADHVQRTTVVCSTSEASAMINKLKHFAIHNNYMDLLTDMSSADDNLTKAVCVNQPCKQLKISDCFISRSNV